MTLLAGAATREISPSESVYLMGYPKFERTSSGIHDPLLASALYLSDGTTRLLFVAVDLLMLSHETVRRCRTEIQAASGIPAGNILISASHTHSGPVTVDLLAFRHASPAPPADPAYIDFVSDQILAAAVSAWRAAVPARAAFAQALANGVGGNRHALDGPHDSQVGIFYLEESATRRPLALSLTYAMHPTVLHEDSRLVSADFPGCARKYLQDALPGVHVLYHNGPCGDLSPRYHVAAQTFTEAERLGNRLGEAVHRAVDDLPQTAFSEQVTLSAAQGWVKLPPRTFPAPEEAEKLLVQSREKYEHLQAIGAPRPELRTAEVDTFGAEERLHLALAQQRGEVAAIQKRYTPSEVQVLRVDETCFVGLPGELFVEYGLQIKHHAPYRTFVISLANGELQGYIVTPESEGYEAAFSLFTPQAGQVLVEEALRLIGEDG